MADDAKRSTRDPGDLERLLERAIAVAQRRRRYRLGLAVIALAVLATVAALGAMLLAGA